MRFIICISELLLILAGLNLGFVGFFEVNPIEALICCPMYLSLFYALVGLAALILAIAKVHGTCLCGCGCTCGSGCTCGPECTCDKDSKKDKKAKK